MAAFHSIWILLMALVVVESTRCHYPTGTGKDIYARNPETTASHAFQDPTFWKHFESEVQLKSWKCNLPAKMLLENMEKDAALYKDDVILRQRRHGALHWMTNETEWITVILGACKELAFEEEGVYSKQLQSLHMLKALADFVEHINCFHMVSSIMTSMGYVFKPLSQGSSSIHDVDKLDPFMMVGYSERREDNVSTSIWDIRVDRHMYVNPHHQTHCIWNECCKGGSCPFYDDIRTNALREMVCDKVSRRVQRNLGGKISREMWDVDATYFKGLPKDWLDKAVDIMQRLKENIPSRR